MQIRKRRPWEIVPSSEVTPESVFLNRREAIKAAALAGGAFLLGPASLALGQDDPKKDEPKKDEAKPDEKKAPDGPYPAKKNEKYKLDRPLTGEKIAGVYNNYYEFSTDKQKVVVLCEKYHYKPEPWKVEIGGACAKPQTLDLDDLRKIEHEERTYRHRCVEAWSMAVPWTGFPLAKLLEKVEPTSDARFVRFISLSRPEEMPGIKAQPQYQWPYFEALTIEEAKNELAFVVTGIYGHSLSKQHGAPIRTAIPWKYGYKSPKSIVKIELVKEKPETFWHKAYPEEYGFYSNVNPAVPHPRWSQASERCLGNNERKDTMLYNGYGEFVADLYKGLELTKPGD